MSSTSSHFLNSGYDDNDDAAAESEESGTGAGPEELGVSSGDDIRMECRIIYHE